MTPIEKALLAAFRQTPDELNRNALADYLEETGRDGGLVRSRWELVLEVMGQHRYFYDRETGPDTSCEPKLRHRVAVADQSGRTPDKTLEGVLYLDRSRPVASTYHQTYAPLVYPDGRETRTPVSSAEARHLKSTFGMQEVQQ
jgi:hypothetical protein